MTGPLARTEDQRAILDAARAMLDADYPEDRPAAGRAPDDPATLAAFGAFALALPEEAGGAGLTVVEEALLHVLLGRRLLSPSALATAVAVRLDPALAAVPVAAGVVSGDAALLLDAAPGPALVRDGTALRLHRVEDPGAEIPGMGGGRPLHRVARPVAEAEAPDEILRLWQILACAQLLGVAEAARDMAVAYAKEREQFGRPIGVFQAIKHHAADMALRAESLSAQLDMAAIAARDGAEDAAFQTAALVRLAPATALANARACIQIHGGMGFSAEARPHLALKQAHVLAALLAPEDLLAHRSPMRPFEEDPACAPP